MSSFFIGRISPLKVILGKLREADGTSARRSARVISGGEGLVPLGTSEIARRSKGVAACKRMSAGPRAVLFVGLP